jgi:hypothetical protein
MKANFLQSDNGANSSTRLMFVVGITWAIMYTTGFSFFAKLGVGEIVALFGGISGPFFALKLIQKPMEAAAEKQILNDGTEIETK